MPPEQPGERGRAPTPSPSFLKSFPKLLLLVTGRFEFELFHSALPLGKKNLLGIMDRIFRHSLIHFVQRMSFFCIKTVFGKGTTKQLVGDEYSWCTTASELPWTGRSEILISCLTKTSAPHGRGKERALSCLIFRVTSATCEREKTETERNAETAGALTFEAVLCRTVAHE